MEDADPVSSDRGMQILATSTFESCRSLDVICVPGGPGRIALMEDDETLHFLRRFAPGCHLVTLVCTGFLALGAAGLLEGYRATCHWSSLDQLRLLGAHPVEKRVVRDRNRITGAGVTSGIDFGLTVVGELAGAEVFQEIQLQMEYDPDPPISDGLAKVCSRRTGRQHAREDRTLHRKAPAATELAAERRRTSA